VLGITHIPIGGGYLYLAAGLGGPGGTGVRLSNTMGCAALDRGPTGGTGPLWTAMHLQRQPERPVYRVASKDISRDRERRDLCGRGVDPGHKSPRVRRIKKRLAPVFKGARKARIQRPGMGKRGGGRVVYYVALGTDRFHMMAAYPKSERDDLSTEQRRRILVALERIKK